uniref:Helicase SKI2W n=2 Tax=Ascaris suum TaxID=6253 RepID=F1KR63_ASCSU
MSLEEGDCQASAASTQCATSYLESNMSVDELNAQVVAEAERVFRHSAIKVLTKVCPEYDISSTYNVPEPKLDVSCLFDGFLSQLPTACDIKPLLNDETGEVAAFEEVCNSGSRELGNAKTSLSLNRLPDPSAHSNAMGVSGNLPFMPGGFEDEIDNVLRLRDLPTMSFDEEVKGIRMAERLVVDLLAGCSDLRKDITDDDVRQVEAVLYGRSTELEPEISVEGTNVTGIDFENADIFELIDFVGQGTQIVVNDEAENRITDQQEKSVTEIGGVQKEKAGTLQETTELNEVLSIEVKDAVLVPPDRLGRKRLPQLDSEFVYAQILDAARTAEEYKQLKPSMARKYPFELDSFQQQAVVCMERGESVFVAAHTSAGKTVVAEYAVALSNIHKTRVIYTSPIKALSNQKFRDFKLVFDDVGLITGDIQLHTDAFALVMTTEVLRSMLYNGSEVIRELEWVIFDEVHYINDAERGHVWEEVLIMLPGHVKIVMLSATVPNCIEFADWVGRIKNRKINVVMTSRRPVPLEHYLYTGQDGKTRKDLFKIVDSNGEFIQRGYSLVADAKSKLRKISSGAKVYRPNSKTDKNIYINLIEHLRVQNLLPMVVFVFSRRRCDENAALLQSVDLTTAKEKSEIHHFFSKCIDRLRGSDKKLPQVLQMAELCKRGFAVHHSGILPILKEVVELLFQKGYVKILFATETFAMGVNMPARTVVFDSMQKHDGREMRTLSPSEYIQMAGRAGRRGLDSTGTVIVLCKGPDAPEPTELTRMMMGKPMKLESRFRVTYSMLLNLLRVEHLRIEDMLQRSYVESASLRHALTRKATLTKVEAVLSSMPPLECDICCTSNETHNSIEDYYILLREFVRFRSDLWLDLLRYPVFDKMLCLGRLVIVCLPEINRLATLAVILKTRNEGTKKVMQLLLSVEEGANAEQIDRQLSDTFNKLSDKEQDWRREFSLIESAACIGLEKLAVPRKGASRSSYRILNDVPVTSLLAICQKTIKVDIGAVVTDARLRAGPRFRSRSPDPVVMKVILEMDSLSEKWSQNAEGPSVALPGRDVQITDVEVFGKIAHLNLMRNSLVDYDRFPCRSCVSFKQHLTNVGERIHLRMERDELLFSLSTGGLLLSDEYCSRIKVLNRLGYVDDSNMVTLKGKVACEIHHQELLVTELMLDNKFQTRSTPEIAAMLSAMTCQYKERNGDILKNNSEFTPPAVLQQLKTDVMQAADKIACVQRECALNAEHPSEELSFALMHVVYEWANATPFSKIMELTDAQEGLIVRCIQRLDELCKDVRNAARLIGNPALYEKMEHISTAIKRDIVFAASLYTVVD